MGGVDKCGLHLSLFSSLPDPRFRQCLGTGADPSVLNFFSELRQGCEVLINFLYNQILEGQVIFFTVDNIITAKATCAGKTLS